MSWLSLRKILVEIESFEENFFVETPIEISVEIPIEIAVGDYVRSYAEIKDEDIT